MSTPTTTTHQGATMTDITPTEYDWRFGDEDPYDAVPDEADKARVRAARGGSLYRYGAATMSQVRNRRVLGPR